MFSAVFFRKHHTNARSAPNLSRPFLLASPKNLSSRAQPRDPLFALGGSDLQFTLSLEGFRHKRLFLTGFSH